MKWQLLGLLLAGAALAQQVDVPNSDFASGDGRPVGWTLSGGVGEWGDIDGDKALGVRGTGTDNNYWRSGPLALEPNTLYRLRYRLRSRGQSGGTPVCGPVFANRDWGTVPAAWRWSQQYFRTPENLTADNAWLRFGQWHVTGEIWFDDISLCRAEPVHQRHGDLLLGEGESLDGLEYAFHAPLGGDAGGDSRPLASTTAGFNTNRWVFGAGSRVVYRHELAGRRQSQGRVTVTVGWYQGGELLVEAAGADDVWRPVGTLGGLGTETFDLPAELAGTVVQVRLSARAKETLGPNSDPGSFQVYGYEYTCRVDGAPARVTGATRYVAVTATAPGVTVALETLGDGFSGGANEALLTIRRPTAERARVTATVTVTDADGPATATSTEVELNGITARVRAPYELPGAGRFELTLALTGAVDWRAEAALRVPDLHAAHYGESLPASSGQVALWWCSSGWKVSRTRPAPSRPGPALKLAAARREVEAAQLVVRPAAALKGLTVSPGPLTGPAGATLGPEVIELLRARYVRVVQPTDSSAVAGWWPDPLPPLTDPLDVAAGENQPLWVRVKVPATAAPGVYRGELTLRADGWRATAPLELTVYDFDLPERMSLTTAFGLNPNRVWPYHGLTTEADRRAVWDRYLANFSAHHISPYNPAPLDPFRVTWPGLGAWEGGRRDRAVKYAGVGSLHVLDDSDRRGPNASYTKLVPIPLGGFRLRFHYRAAAGHKFIVSLNHHDEAGQWMSGRNNNLPVEGTGEWALFERTVTGFPVGARAVRLNLWPCLYADDGSTTGEVWFDDLTLTNAATGESYVEGGDFEPPTAAALTPVIDWTAWDKAMERALDHYRFNSFRLPILGLGGGTFHERYEPNLLGYGEDTPEYQIAFRAYLTQVQEHLRAKGWLDEAYVYWFDEPDPKDYEFVSNGFRKLKEIAPDIRRMLTEQPEEGLLGGPNIWCPVTSSFRPETAAPRLAAGETFWWYVCTGPKAPYVTLFIDHPGTELRVWSWQTWQRGITGLLIWETAYWTSPAAYPDAPQNPYEDPMGWVSGYGTPAGTRRPWGNGDGRLVYPPEAGADGRPAAPLLTGPVDSQRWEMLRDGIEDYEYHVLLRQLLERRRNRLTPALHQRYAALLEVPAAVTADMTTFCRDPAPLEQQRERLARAIEELSRL